MKKIAIILFSICLIYQSQAIAGAGCDALDVYIVNLTNKTFKSVTSDTAVHDYYFSSRVTPSTSAAEARNFIWSSDFQWYMNSKVSAGAPYLLTQLPHSKSPIKVGTSKYTFQGGVDTVIYVFDLENKMIFRDTATKFHTSTDIPGNVVLGPMWANSHDINFIYKYEIDNGNCATLKPGSFTIFIGDNPWHK